jgi:predicted nucleotidyltransferase
MNFDQYRKEIEALCEKHKVDSLYLVGSFAKGTFSKESDVDFLVTFGQVDLNTYADNYYDLVTSLETLLGRRVDLISEKVVTNPYLLKSFNRNRVKIYERTNPRLAA